MIYIGSKVPITPKEKSIALQEIHSIFQLHSIIFSYPVWLEYYSTPLDIWACLLSHYYKTLICSGWETPVGNARPGQKGKGGALLSRVWQPGQKAPFCPGWCYQPGQKVYFFPVSLFSIPFLFQLYFYISIILMYWNSVCKISTNIYIYIVTYIIFVLDSFHI